LKRLGYRVTGPNGVDDPEIATNLDAMVRDLVARFDAFQDNPWPVIYRSLDRDYPGSKFVLSLRAPESWIRSVRRHFGSQSTPMRQWIYGAGCPAGNEALYLRRFEAHNREVLDYFRDRPDDLVTMNLAEGDGWEKLCVFLGKETPDIAFPHLNRGGVR
jgi:hypothetical protein